MFMKLKNFKKKIETVLFKRICNENKYIIFSSNVQNNLFISNSYNILNYSLKHSLQIYLNKSLTNNFLKSFFFANLNDFNLFIKNLKISRNLIYFIKFKNLYFFGSEFKNKFDNININIYVFISRLYKLLLNWIPLLKLIIKNSSK